jgi:hypothetical protein
MAQTTSVSQLYAGLTQLAYSASQMASVPLLPFTPPDIPRLLAHSTSLAAIAVNIHNRDPNALIQSAVEDALTHVQLAQSVFDLINGNATNALGSTTVFDIVTAAIGSTGTV